MIANAIVVPICTNIPLCIPGTGMPYAMCCCTFGRRAKGTQFFFSSRPHTRRGWGVSNTNKKLLEKNVLFNKAVKKTLFCSISDKNPNPLQHV